YNNPSTRSGTRSPFLLDVQSNHLGNLISRVVIPLTRVAGNYTASKVAQDLSPIIEIEGEPFVLETPLLGAFRTSDLGPAIGTLKDEQSRISAALDRLFGAYRSHLITVDNAKVIAAASATGPCHVTVPMLAVTRPHLGAAWRGVV
ncbi:CcdB family protein, partial [Paraburkholderia sp. J11-2]|uniref:CcdB family protein n=1 Tax=Paraburkholderia sp. J11-2 TaxID=2805431 RepID=UPI002AB6C145